jgi:hypothetical protein
MRDVASCPGRNATRVCPMRDTCYRYLKDCEQMQVFMWPDNIGSECEQYIESEHDNSN